MPYVACGLCASGVHLEVEGHLVGDHDASAEDE